MKLLRRILALALCLATIAAPPEYGYADEFPPMQELEIVSMDVQPSVDPSAEPTPELSPSVDPSAEPTPEVSPSVDPSAEPTPEVSPSVNPSAEPTPELSPSADPSAEPTPELSPSVDPSAEPTPELSPSADPSAEPTPELSPSADPSAEPTPEVSPSVNPSAEPTPEVSPSVNPSAEPTPEVSPSADPSAEPSPTENPPAMQSSRQKLTLAVKEKAALEVFFSDGNSYAVTFSSSKPKIASVSADGVVTGKNRGDTTISITSAFGETIKIPVTVKYAPKSITLKAEKTTLGVGESITLKHSVNAYAAAAVIAYSSSDPSVAGVDAGGRITALAPGKATITGKSFNNKKGSITITVLPAPESIQFEQESLVLGIGQKFTPAVQLSPDSAASIAFRSEQGDIISVDPASGEILALSAGEAILQAETHNGQTAELPVQVKNAPSCVSFTQKSITVAVGEKVQLPDVILGAEGEDCAAGTSFKSSAGKYASVNSGGVITGKRAGTAKITVTTHNQLSSTLTVHIKAAPKSVSLSAKALTLGAGEQTAIKASLPKKTAGRIDFSSSDSSVATVDANGVITAIQPGTATITAATFNNKKASCTVTVLNAPDRIDLNLSACTLGVGENAALKVALPEGSAGACTFASSDSAVAAVDENGNITGAAPGTAIITATAYNQAGSSCIVTVKNAPSKIAFRESGLTLSVGDTYQLLPPEFSGDDPACSTYRYQSKNTKYLTVKNGLLTARRAGKVDLTVTSYNRKTATLKVVIKAAPKSVAFAENSHTVFVGCEIMPAVQFSNKATGNYTLSSLDESIVRVAADGKTLIGVREGSAQVRATTFNGKSALADVHVPPLPDSVSLAQTEITLGAGDTAALTAILPEGQGSALCYASGDASVAAVDGNGVITALSAGQAEITVRTLNDHTASCRLTVLQAPTRLQLSPSSARRSIDESSLQLDLSFGHPEEGGRICYTSSDPSIATVDANGLVSFHAVGSVCIRAEAYNGVQASSSITIGETPGDMFYPQDTYRIALGDRICIPAAFDRGCESYTAATADGEIAAVQDDWISALKIGATRLEARSISGLNAACTIEVMPPPTGIELAEARIDLIHLMEPAAQLHARVLPDGVGTIHYSSSDPAVAIVDANGLVTAVAPGTCSITAVTYDGFYAAQCEVEVHPLLEGVKIGIDPGHQRKQNTGKEALSPTSKSRKQKVSSGTCGRYTRVPEYVVTLQIGLKLREALESYGAEVYMTRESHDVDISNQQRAKMMNELGVDLVLRVHCNGSKSSRHNGMSIYVRKTGVGKQESAAAAKLILGQMVSFTGAKNLGVNYTDKFTGLNWSTVPSMLMELGYMSNPTEDRLLVSSAYQDKLVQGMVNGICQYMNRTPPYAPESK